MTSRPHKEEVELWAAINNLVTASGGSNNAAASRMAEVSAVEAALRRLVCSRRGAEIIADAATDRKIRGVDAANRSRPQRPGTWTRLELCRDSSILALILGSRRVVGGKASGQWSLEHYWLLNRTDLLELAGACLEEAAGLAPDDLKQLPKREETCPACAGRGYVGFGDIRCEACQGLGRFS